MARTFASYKEVRLENGTKVVIRRSETRFYFGEQGKIRMNFGMCLGAFYLQNPGSALYTCSHQTNRSGLKSWRWGSIAWYKEQLLPQIQRVLDSTLCKVKKKKPGLGRNLEQNAYIQILNLSYIRDPSDANSSIRQWRERILAGDDKDDTPTNYEKLKFVVFGWGGNTYEPLPDGSRISSCLAKFTTKGTYFLFPSKGNIERNGYCNRKKIKKTTRDAIREELKKYGKSYAVYPCGGRNDRHAFMPKYTNAVSSALAKILLEN